MVARALLLSADEKISTLLSSALSAESCKLDRCKDIFSAVETFTRERFDVVLIDWHEPLEANFLLQTARDSKPDHPVFVVGLVTPAQGREALESGADAILAKPFSAEQAAEILSLGIECLPVDAGDDSERETGRPGAPSHRPLAPAPASDGPVARLVPAGLASLTRRPGQPSPRQSRGATQKQVTHVPVSSPTTSEPSLSTQSRRSRMLSLTAVVWPIIVVAALLGFDQWPYLSRRSFPQLSNLLHAAHSTREKMPGSSSDQATPQYATIPMSDDLLSDYGGRAASLPVASPDPSLAPKTPDAISVASMQALPFSSRLIAPVFRLEPSRPKLEVPSSLRVPPSGENAVAVTPSGHLVAPDWNEAPIALPETVSRVLLEHQVAPQYPEQALATGADGAVVLQVSIGKDGAVRELKLVSGNLMLAHAAVDAVRQWRYRPYRRNGKNVEIETLITVNFKRPPRG